MKNVVSGNESFDVLIIGAGPAGSFAAEKIARGGARVALFDGRPAREAKACGGGVTSKALKAWPFLLEAGGRAVTEVEMLSPSGERVHLKLAEPFAIYSRCAFDSYMRERARRAGAHVFECRVSASTEKDGRGVWVVRTKGGVSWSGDVLAAADGANSAIARRLAGPLPNSEMEVAFGYRTPLDEADEAPTVIAFLPGWAGYAWAFPRLDHISFGIATAQDTFDHKALDRMLWDFMVGYYRAREDDAGEGRRNGKRSEDERRNGERDAGGKRVEARDREIEARLRERAGIDRQIRDTALPRTCAAADSPSTTAATFPQGDTHASRSRQIQRSTAEESFRQPGNHHAGWLAAGDARVGRLRQRAPGVQLRQGATEG